MRWVPSVPAMLLGCWIPPVLLAAGCRVKERRGEILRFRPTPSFYCNATTRIEFSIGGHNSRAIR